jgi:hypothetical protein
MKTEVTREKVRVGHPCPDYSPVFVPCVCGQAAVILCSRCSGALFVIAVVPACSHAVAVVERRRA